MTDEAELEDQLWQRAANGIRPEPRERPKTSRARASREIVERKADEARQEAYELGKYGPKA